MSDHEQWQVCSYWRYTYPADNVRLSISIVVVPFLLYWSVKHRVRDNPLKGTFERSAERQVPFVLPMDLLQCFSS